ncbi:uncharacterized protein LOC5507836 [Nematostella vectensis]|uniref:uncharacterized protein LOC5507836 n=1 Tax=Nematostella vectensis TaxID=45351 RepID=UPI0020772974|nr:uncharacterized protein LOC5507836 [Nematostella vectensis]
MFKFRRLITGLLVVMFCMASVVKLTDQIDNNAHQIMKKEFSRFAKVNPLTLLFKVSLDPVKFMKGYGIIEGIIGVLLLIGTKPVRLMASFAGLVVMGTTLQMLIVLGDPKFTLIPASFASICLLLNIYLVATRPEEPETREKME